MSIPSPASLIGHQAVLESFRQAGAAERLHHAYLLMGPPHIGKRSLALQLARGWACEAAPGGEACERCPRCKQMLVEQHPDLVLIGPDHSAARPVIKVEQIRKLIQQLTLRNFNAPRRTVIIEDADRLMPQAANALLKTLEEPPPSTGFFLISARPAAVLGTLRSRCQQIAMRPVPSEELESWLRSRGEARAATLSRWSEGAPGAALRLADGQLEQLESLRDRLLTVLASSAGAREDFARDLAKGEGAEGMDALLSLLETLLRDVVCRALGRPELCLHGDLESLRPWERLWPEGVTRIQDELELLRERRGRHVNARLMLESLLARVKLELG